MFMLELKPSVVDTEACMCSHKWTALERLLKWNVAIFVFSDPIFRYLQILLDTAVQKQDTDYEW